MHAPVTLLRLAVDAQVVDWRELIPEVEAGRTDRREIAESGADRIAEVADAEVECAGPHIAVVEEHDRAQLAPYRHSRLAGSLDERVAADGKTESAQRADLEPAPSAKARRAAQEEPLVERHIALEVAPAVDRAGAEAIRQHERPSDRQVMPYLSLHQPVVEVTPQPRTRLLDMPRDHIALPCVEHAVRRRAADVERNGRERAPLLPGARVEAQRDQLVPDREIEQPLGIDAAPLVLVDERQRPFVGGVGLMREDDASTQPVGRVHRLPGLPRLASETQREIRAEEIGLLEVRPHTAVERRPLPLEPGVARAAGEVHVVPPDTRPRPFLAAVPDAPGEALVLALGDGHARGNLDRLLVALLARLDVRELEQLHAIQLALALAHLGALEQVARLERELPFDHVLVHA